MGEGGSAVPKTPSLKPPLKPLLKYLFHASLIYLFKSSDVLKTIPRCGYWNMCGHLHPRGHKVQWDRIQDSMRRLCLEEILMWALQLMAVRCRTYFVQALLSLWHINGNHKLIRQLLSVAGNHKSSICLANIWMIMVSRPSIADKQFSM